MYYFRQLTPKQCPTKVFAQFHFHNNRKELYYMAYMVTTIHHTIQTFRNNWVTFIICLTSIGRLYFKTSSGVCEVYLQISKKHNKCSNFYRIDVLNLIKIYFINYI